jgi:hypothetical protein
MQSVMRYAGLAFGMSCLMMCRSFVEAAAVPASQEEVAALAERIPRLRMPADGTAPFILRAVMPRLEDHYAIEILWTGRQYRAALLGLSDGTPLVISDESHYLACDFPSHRVWGASPARLSLIVRPNPNAPGGLLVTELWDCDADAAEKLRPAEIDFRTPVQQVVAEARIERREDGTVVLSQPFAANRLRVVTFAAPPSQNLTIAQYDLKAGQVTSYFEIIRDGIDASSPAYHMPQPIEIDAATPISLTGELWQDGGWQRSGTLAAIRDAARGDGELRGRLRQYTWDWDEVAANDRELTTKFAKAVAGTGAKFVLPVLPPLPRP